MTYNIHPIFVHFPIALLFLYSLVKIFPFEKWFPKVSWRHIETFLLTFGVLGALAAIYTGGLVEHLVDSSNRQLVHMHELFAQISAFIYGALLLGEILYFLTPTNSFLIFIQNILTKSFVSKILAALGLVAITITGMLGGVIVFGLSADPLAPIVLHILGITY